MLNKFNILFLAGVLCMPAFLFAQHKVSGVVLDGTSSEPLIGANILYAEGQGTVTDFDGKFELVLVDGSYNLKVSYVGFENAEKAVTVSGSDIYLKFELVTESLKEVKITADVARSRETPVAFSNVPAKKIEEELANQDIPMLLNSTPGVYATQEGGGDGDARITIRGFNQRNIAVMIDGIPVNDMENGWVYWSNWSGLDVVTRNVQVQRGLGASKLALPSVGGTMNILTKGIEAKESIKIKQDIGSNGYFKTTFGLTTGRLKNGWGISAAGSYKRGNGWVDETWTKGGFYFLRVDKMLGDGRHIISAIASGGPQKHGQRPQKEPIDYFDADRSRDLFEEDQEIYELFIKRDRFGYSSSFTENDSLFYADMNSRGFSRSETDELMENFSDTTNAFDYGLRHNRFWGYLERYEIDANGDTMHSDRKAFNTRVNHYHKPQISLRHSWNASEKFFLSNVVYFSRGKGGGTRLEGGGTAIDENGQLNMQRTYDRNYANLDIDGERQSSVIIQSSNNEHIWYGLLSTMNYKINSSWSVSGGLDLRSYRGIHTSSIWDLLGGDFFYDPGKSALEQGRNKKREGDIIARNYDGLVRWGGAFAQAEYKTEKWSAFLNASAAGSGYKRIDFWRPKDLVLADTTFIQALGYGATSRDNFTDSIFYNGRLYTPESAEARDAQTDWEWLPGYTFKTGANYNINDNHNVFFNTGFLSKAPRFDNVISRDNKIAQNIKNEIVQAFEVGHSMRYHKFASNVNLYYTNWANKPIIASAFFDGERLPVNINELSARHMGIEFDFSVKIRKNLELEGLLSIGDWRWTSGDSIEVLDDRGNPPDNPDDQWIDFDATDVHVGDAAQIQVGGSLRYEPFKGLYIKIKTIFFGKHFSDFNPETLQKGNKRRESWKLPAYNLVDLNLGYRFNRGTSRFAVNLSVINLLNTAYLSDGENNDNRQNFNAESAGVFFGQGTRFNASLVYTLSNFKKAK